MSDQNLVGTAIRAGVGAISSKVAIWVLTGLLVVLGMGATYAYLWHTSKVDDAFKAGRAHEQNLIRGAQTEQAQADAEMIARLTTRNKELQDEILKQNGALDAFNRRQRELERMRQQDRDRLLADIAAASADAVRRYAETTAGHLEGCRADVERFGSEAVRGAVAAYALRRTLEDRNAEIEARRAEIIKRRDALNLKTESQP